MGPGGADYVVKKRIQKILWDCPFNTITHGPWTDQPTDFIMPKTQNSLKFKNMIKICYPFLVSYKQLLFQKIYHKVPSYAFFCMFLV